MYASVYLNYSEKGKKPIVVGGTEFATSADAWKAADNTPELVNYRKHVFEYDHEGSTLKFKSFEVNPGAVLRTMNIKEKEEIMLAISSHLLISRLEDFSSRKERESAQGGTFQKFKERFSRTLNLGRTSGEQAAAAKALMQKLKDAEDPQRAALNNLSKNHKKALTKGSLAEMVQLVPHIHRAMKEKKDDSLANAVSRSLNT